MLNLARSGPSRPFGWTLNLRSQEIPSLDPQGIPSVKPTARLPGNSRTYPSSENSMRPSVNLLESTIEHAAINRDD